MPINSHAPERWKSDIAESVDLYNNWFIKFAPKAYRDTRLKTTKQVESALELTVNLTNLTPLLLQENPVVLPILRMATAPPIARDRLIGLAQVSPGLVKSMEVGIIPPRMKGLNLNSDLQKISQTIRKLVDIDIFTWLEKLHKPSKEEIYRAATIVADRLCGAVADPIVRNAQEQRQLAYIKEWLEKRGYSFVKAGTGIQFNAMKPGTFLFRLNVPVKLTGGTKKINIPMDAVIMPLKAKVGDFPILIEAKSAGDFTNTNKRRKEEAVKISQLRSTYGKRINFILFLCGYFDSGYLGYEAAEGIDWVWEHRIEDLCKIGI
jgi:hypothetical protein